MPLLPNSLGLSNDAELAFFVFDLILGNRSFFEKEQDALDGEFDSALQAIKKMFANQ